jgi:hypothetical protein
MKKKCKHDWGDEGVIQQTIYRKDKKYVVCLKCGKEKRI